MAMSIACRRLHRRLMSSFAAKEIRDASMKSQTDVTLRTMFDLGRVKSSSAALVQSAMFLREELPIRLAKRVIELENLPYGLSSMPSVKKVHGLYVDSFKQLNTSPKPHTAQGELEFKEIIQSMLQRHRDVVPLMAMGIKELKQTSFHQATGHKFIDECPFLQDFLDRFYSSRIGIRILIAHHIALHESKPGWVGVIQEDCSPAQVLADAITHASELCERTLGSVPEVEVKGHVKLLFPYIPDHIHYILFELLKNSMRAIVEKHGNSSELPPIEIVIADGEDDIVMKVTDCGGGIRRKDIDLVWTYSYTTAPTPKQPIDSDRNASIGGLIGAPMAGFGYGLPISRLHARAFKGDLVLIPMDGYGLDAYLYLTKLSSATASTVPK